MILTPRCTTFFLAANVVLVMAAPYSFAVLPVGGFLNGSFETGDFTNWFTQDVSDAEIELAVRPVGAIINAGVLDRDYLAGATDGDFSASHGFSSALEDAAPNITIAQDILVDAPLLRFDHKTSWFSAFTFYDKVFQVDIEPTGGGEALATYEVFVASGLDVMLAQEFTPEVVDLSDFLGQSVRVSFEWVVGDTFVHPAIVELDNVRLAPIPEPSTLATICLAAALAGTARRRLTHAA